MYSRLPHWCLSVLAVCAICLQNAAPLVQAQTPPVVEPSLALKVSADRQDATYRVGEVATFTVEVTRDGATSSRWRSDLRFFPGMDGSRNRLSW